MLLVIPITAYLIRNYDYLDTTIKFKNIHVFIKFLHIIEHPMLIDLNFFFRKKSSVMKAMKQITMFQNENEVLNVFINYQYRPRMVREKSDNLKKWHYFDGTIN